MVKYIQKVLHLNTFTIFNTYFSPVILIVFVLVRAHIIDLPHRTSQQMINYYHYCFGFLTL